MSSTFDPGAGKLRAPGMEVVKNTPGFDAFFQDGAESSPLDEMVKEEVMGEAVQTYDIATMTSPLDTPAPSHLVPAIPDPKPKPAPKIKGKIAQALAEAPGSMVATPPAKGKRGRPRKGALATPPSDAPPVKEEAGTVIVLPDLTDLIPEEGEQHLAAAYRKLDEYAAQINVKREQGSVLRCCVCNKPGADHSRFIKRDWVRDPVTKIGHERLYCSETCYVMARRNHPEWFEPQDMTGAHLSSRGQDGEY